MLCHRSSSSLGLVSKILLGWFTVLTACSRTEPSEPRGEPVAVATVTLSAVATVAPSATEATVASASAPAPVVSSASALGLAVSAECRGGRLSWAAVKEKCRSANSKRGSVLPEAIVAEIAGPDEVKAGEVGEFEVQLVNPSKGDVALTVRLTCGPSITAVDGKGREVIEYERTDGAETLSECSSRGTVIDVVSEPGGSLTTPFSWKARRERYRDGKRVEAGPLQPGQYKLRAFTWLERGDADEEEKSHGVSVAVVAERSVAVR